MIIKIKAVTENGKKAILKIHNEKSFGIAKKKIISIEPLILEIKVNLPVPYVLLEQPQIKNAVLNPTIEMLETYGALSKDYTIELNK